MIIRTLSSEKLMVDADKSTYEAALRRGLDAAQQIFNGAIFGKDKYFPEEFWSGF